jgi:putative NIF3 family GTP cyclohydrolase 1 type 2
MELMHSHDLDVIVAGEILEWTLCAYVRDAAQLGLNKALIVAGHNRTEEAGMKHLPGWLSTVLPGLPVFFVEAGDPYHYV